MLIGGGVGSCGDAKMASLLRIVQPGAKIIKMLGVFAHQHHGCGMTSPTSDHKDQVPYPKRIPSEHRASFADILTVTFSLFFDCQ
jgi:hypothetical protein